MLDAMVNNVHESALAPNPSQASSASPQPGLLPATDQSPPVEQQQPAPLMLLSVAQAASASPQPGLLPATDPSPPIEQQQPAPLINRRLIFDAQEQLEESLLSPSTPPGFTDSPGENGTISCCCMLTAHMRSWKDTRNVVVA